MHLLGINLQISMKNVRDLESVFISFKLTPSTRAPQCPARRRSPVPSVCRMEVAHCGEWLVEVELLEQGREGGRQGTELLLLLLLQRGQPCWSGNPLQGPFLLVDATVHCSPRPAEMKIPKSKFYVR